ncbi:hypothetical protein B296_00004430 [Ensete ventricosum]|uniref:Uncharacterized protein n=1 Tax=Ensete ventricosum TaxID=4639 RepID=A0A427AW84_ENSVE|nr:hypothetical protein B296_00004430 [Ensete ventricosum]
MSARVVGRRLLLLAGRHYDRIQSFLRALPSFSPPPLYLFKILHVIARPVSPLLRLILNLSTSSSKSDGPLTSSIVSLNESEILCSFVFCSRQVID